MPYTGPGDAKLPDRIKAMPQDTRAAWVEVWNDAYSECMEDGGDSGECEGQAFRLANGVIEEHMADTVNGMAEAATLKTQAQALMRDMVAILARRDVPAAVRKEIEDVRAILKRTWADLADAANGEGGMGELAEIAMLNVDGKRVALAELVEGWKRRIAEQAMKTIDGVQYPASAFLVVEDPEVVTTWHLPVYDEEGNPDHRLMGAAWAALMNPRGSRGNRYEGPGKAAAIRKLRALYRSEDMPTPNTSSESAVREMYDEGPVMMTATTLADLRAQRQANSLREAAEHLFHDFSQVSASIFYSSEITDKGAAILALASELAQELRNLEDVASMDGAMEESAQSDGQPEQGEPTGGDPIAEDDVQTGTEEPIEEGDMPLVQEVTQDITQETQEVTESNETERLCESVAGAEVLSLGRLAEAESGGPLTVKVRLIKPGPGNKADNHYYPRTMLERDASRFAGAKMYESDHGEDKTTRTWVSTVRQVSEFDEDGSPLAEVVVHDPSFAERLRNLSQAEMLDKMECSILASGRVREGEIDGSKYRIVEGIEQVESVDWVTRAGAGGQAVSLAESDREPGEGGSPENTEQVEDMVEDQQEQAEAETQEPQAMSQEAVRAWLADHANLPEPVSELLAEREYADETALEDAVQRVAEGLKRALSGTGVTGNGPGEREKPRSRREAEARYAERLDEVNKRHLGR